MTSSRNKSLKFTALAGGLAVMGAIAVAACAAKDDGNTVANNGGAANTAGGGAGNAGGALNNGAGNAATGAGNAATGAGNAATGAGNAATGAGNAATGAGNAASGAVGNTGNNAAAGASGASGPMPFACAMTPVAGELVTAFDEGTDMWDSTAGSLPGGVYAYGGPTESTAGNNLMVDGAVADYAGFGVYFDECMDASAYDGVQFMIGGTGVGTTLKFNIQTNTNYNIGGDAGDEMKGACEFTESTKYSACVAAGITFDLPATPTLVGFTWAQLTGGKPDASPNPADIVGLQWQFDGDGSGGETVSISVDDINFFMGAGPGTGPSTGGGASGGAGGTSGGGGASAGGGAAAGGGGGAAAGGGAGGAEGGAGGAAGGAAGAGMGGDGMMTGGAGVQ